MYVVGVPAESTSATDGSASIKVLGKHPEWYLDLTNP
jgi:hypothetical protein